MADFNGPVSQLYRKIPMTVRAMQWDGTMANAGDIVEWVESLNVGENKIRYLEPNDSPDRKGHCIRLNTKRGIAYAYPNDWVVWGTNNDIYPCDDETFKEVFELLVTV